MKRYSFEEELLQALKAVIPKPMPFPIQRVFYGESCDPITLLANSNPTNLKLLIFPQPEDKIRKFPITGLSGLLAGNVDTAHGEEYQSFSDFSHKLRNDFPHPNRIGFETDDDFQTNLEFIKLRRRDISASKDGIFPLYYLTWSNRYHLHNTNGAHHLAALYRQCHEQSRKLRLPCRIQTIEIDKNLLSILSQHNRWYIVHRKTWYKLQYVMQQFSIHEFEMPHHHPFGCERSLLWLSDLKSTTAPLLKTFKTFPKDHVYGLSSSINRILAGL